MMPTTPKTAEEARKMAVACGRKANSLMRTGEYIAARYQIERARCFALLAIEFEQDSPSPAVSLQSVMPAPVMSPIGAAPAGAASPSKSGPAGSLVDLPEEVPFQ